MFLPFDPITRSYEIENIVMKGNERLYSRFRYADYYGGVITADSIGCNLLCSYCWNYFKNEDPLKATSLGFFSPSKVAQKLQSMGKSNSCTKYRISGCEPFLGEASTRHLTEIIKSVQGDFIIESNGLMLGYNTKLINILEGLDNLLIRIAVKADNPRVFQMVTGSKGSYQPYQVKAIKALRANCIDVSVAYMEQFVNPALLGFGSNEEFDSEGLRYYGGTKQRLEDRGLLEEIIKPKKAVKKVEKPKELENYNDVGDIT